MLDVDFRMPTQAELDDMEAFQLSIGRQTTPIIDPLIPGSLVFNDAQRDRGTDPVCRHAVAPGHAALLGLPYGGGALNDVGQNEQRANGNEVSPDAPTCFFDAPGDGGFRLRPVQRSTAPRSAPTGRPGR